MTHEDTITVFGWVIVAMITALFAGVAYQWRRNDRRLDKQDVALVSLTTSQAVIVASLVPLEASKLRVETKVSDLDKAVAVLQNEVAKHERWHERHV